MNGAPDRSPANATGTDRGTCDHHARGGEGAPLRVTVLFFARAAELAGTRRLELRLPPGALVQGIWDALRAQAPATAEALSSLRAHLAVARNQRYARGSEPVADGDELAFIPPVSGG